MSFNYILFSSFKKYLAQQELATLMEAFAIYEANSCITFVKRTTEEYYISVEKTGGGWDHIFKKTIFFQR